jgi:hypothetical protein
VVALDAAQPLPASGAAGDADGCVEHGLHLGAQLGA